MCAISNEKVILFYISDDPIDTNVYNSFLWILSDQFQNNQNRLYFLNDIATFHNISDATRQHLIEKNIVITRSIPLVCFINPIEEFFSIVHNYFEKLLDQRMLNIDQNLTKFEYIDLIKKSVK